jgi:hypothetical protein
MRTPANLAQVLELEASIRNMEETIVRDRDLLRAIRRGCAHEWGDAMRIGFALSEDNRTWAQTCKHCHEQRYYTGATPPW